MRYTEDTMMEHFDTFVKYRDKIDSVKDKEYHSDAEISTMSHAQYWLGRLYSDVSIGCARSKQMYDSIRAAECSKLISEGVSVSQADKESKNIAQKQFGYCTTYEGIKSGISVYLKSVQTILVGHNTDKKYSDTKYTEHLSKIDIT